MSVLGVNAQGLGSRGRSSVLWGGGCKLPCAGHSRFQPVWETGGNFSHSGSTWCRGSSVPERKQQLRGAPATGDPVEEQRRVRSKDLWTRRERSKEWLKGTPCPRGWEWPSGIHCKDEGTWGWEAGRRGGRLKLSLVKCKAVDFLLCSTMWSSLALCMNMYLAV